MEKKLFRNEHDKMIAGVCSGLADYMQTDVTVIRMLAVLLVFFGAGSSIPIYIILWIIVPVNNDPNARMRKFNEYFNKQDPNLYNAANAFNNAENADQNKWNTPNAAFNQDKFNKGFKRNDQTGRTIGGLVLLVIGLIFLMRQLDFIPHWFSFVKMWPAVLVIIGFVMILRSKKDKNWEQFKADFEASKGNMNANSADPNWGDVKKDFESNDANLTTENSKSAEEPSHVADENEGKNQTNL